MLGDIVIVEPNATIVFTSKRAIGLQLKSIDKPIYGKPF
jgi:acetyl-CoA carboxylase beta subunit